MRELGVCSEHPDGIHEYISRLVAIQIYFKCLHSSIFNPETGNIEKEFALEKFMCTEDKCRSCGLLITNERRETRKVLESEKDANTWQVSTF